MNWRDKFTEIKKGDKLIVIQDAILPNTFDLGYKMGDILVVESVYEKGTYVSMPSQQAYKVKDGDKVIYREFVEKL